ncbi:RNA polymerase sigma factor [Actinotalea lenta]|nr:sigma-70 family RNA polymerase sigma factor [Isoptericola sp. b490]
MTLGERGARALVEYREGRTGAFEAFVRDATPLLWHVVRGQGVAREQAEDVVQGVWVSFVRHAETIREPQAALAWLLVSARRAAWSAVRGTRAAAARARPLPDDIDEAGEVPDAGVGPERHLLETERDRTLWRVFARLPERCRQILRCVAAADRPDYRAIAEVTGMKVTAVGVTRGRCLAKLRALLDQDDRWEWS